MKRFPLAVRLLLAPFRIVATVLFLPILVVLIFAGEPGLAETIVSKLFGEKLIGN